jgi:hypothetical protein
VTLLPVQLQERGYIVEYLFKNNTLNYMYFKNIFYENNEIIYIYIYIYYHGMSGWLYDFFTNSLLFKNNF